MTVYDRDYRLAKSVLPTRYDLRFDLDLDTWTSKGSAKIALQTAEPGREIVLHAVDLDITSATVDGDNKMESVRFEAAAQVAILRFAKDMVAGQHSLEITWTGGIRDSLRGLYRSVRGEERYAATQFEAADARRAFPCFDEPEFKAIFAIELTHPAGNAAISNMPVTREEQIAENRTRTRFRETPVRISTYLVAFTVGPYEATPVALPPSKIPVRTWLPPGLASQSIYARDASLVCDRGVIRQGAPDSCPMRRQDRLKMEALRCLRPPQFRAVDSLAHQPVFDPLDRIAQRQGRNSCRCPIEPVEHSVDQFGAWKGPGAVMN